MFQLGRNHHAKKRLRVTNDICWGGSWDGGAPTTRQTTRLHVSWCTGRQQHRVDWISCRSHRTALSQAHPPHWPSLLEPLWWMKVEKAPCSLYTLTQVISQLIDASGWPGSASWNFSCLPENTAVLVLVPSAPPLSSFTPAETTLSLAHVAFKTG